MLVYMYQRDYHLKKCEGHSYPSGFLSRYFWWYSSASNHSPAGTISVTIVFPL